MQAKNVHYFIAFCSMILISSHAGILTLWGRDKWQQGPTSSHDPHHGNISTNHLLWGGEPRTSANPVCPCCIQTVEETRPGKGSNNMLSPFLVCPQPGHQQRRGEKFDARRCSWESWDCSCLSSVIHQQRRGNLYVWYPILLLYTVYILMHLHIFSLILYYISHLDLAACK